MNEWEVIGGALVVFSAALVLGLFFERMRQSAVLGYLLAGMVLGPYGMQVMDVRDAVVRMAELGVALLLFTIGLEFSWRRLRKLGARALWLGFGQVGLTMLVAGIVARLCGMSGPMAVVVGSIVSLSSTACVMRALQERAQTDSVVGRTCLAVLLLQDIAVVVLVLLIGMLGGGGTATDVVIGVAKAVGLMAVLLGGIWFMSVKIMPHLMQIAALTRNRELLVLLAAVVALSSAWAAHAMHLSPILGTFIAGMMLGDSPFAVQMRSDMSALRSLFGAIFFTSIGMLGDAVWAAEHLLLVVAVTAAVLVGKTAIIAGVGYILKLPLRHALASGICLSQVGEFSFVLARQARDVELMDLEQFKLFAAVIVVTMLVTNYLVGYSWLLAGKITGGGGDPMGTGGGERGPLSGHVILCGMGPSGQAVLESLQRAEVHVTVVELNAQTAAAARAKGIDIHVGDATSGELLEHLHVDTARAVVVTLPDPTAAAAVVHQVRVLAPDVPIVARSRYHAYVQRITDAGASTVVDEEQETGRRLTAAVRLITRGAGAGDGEA